MLNKILIVGKQNHLYWTEHVYNGFCSAGFETELFYTNSFGLKGNIYKGLEKLGIGKNHQLKILQEYISVFKPKIVLFVGVFFCDIQLLKYCSERKIITLGWAGDIFGENNKYYNEYLDFLFVSDTAMIKIGKELNFKNVIYLPFAYNTNLHLNHNLERTNEINFIGSYTKDRDEVFSYLTDYPLNIQGTNWNKLTKTSDNWFVSNKKIDQTKVVDIYNKTNCTLNIAQKSNVINMINMRTFEAMASGSCLINDNVKDLENYFEDGKDILIYRNTDELLEIVRKVDLDPKFARKIASNAYKKITSGGFSYIDRANEIINNIG